MEDLGIARVLRCGGEKGEEPYFEVFKDVPYVGRSVLDVLNYLYEDRDSSLAFRHSCRVALCNVCTVKVNGKAVLSCKALATKEMTIEPPAGFGLIRDLVTDRTKVGGGAEDVAS